MVSSALDHFHVLPFFSLSPYVHSRLSVVLFFLTRACIKHLLKHALHFIIARPVVQISMECLSRAVAMFVFMLIIGYGATGCSPSFELSSLVWRVFLNYSNPLMAALTISEASFLRFFASNERERCEEIRAKAFSKRISHSRATIITQNKKRSYQKLNLARLKEFRYS